MGDIPRSDSVGQARETTAHTGETRLRHPVGLIHQPTGGASTRGVPWVYQDYRHPGQLRLVLDELAKLVEGPGMVLASLALADGYPVADALEVLQGQATPSVEGFRHHLLADEVVHMAAKSPLLLSPASQQSFSRAGTLALELGPQSGVAVPQSVDLATGIGLTVRVGQDIDNTQVAAEKCLSLVGHRFGSIYHLVDKEATLPVDEGGLMLAREDNAGTALAGEAAPVEGHGAVPLVTVPVEGYGPQGSELGQGCSFSPVFVASGDFTDGHHRLGAGQAKVSAQLMVGPALERKPGEDAFLEGDLGQPVASSVELPHHGEEGVRLSPYRHYGGELHALII